jgi:hypothetical protein
MDVLTVLQQIGKNGGKETIVNGVKRYEDENTAIEFGKPSISRCGDINSGIKIIFKCKVLELTKLQKTPIIITTIHIITRFLFNCYYQISGIFCGTQSL